MIKNKMKEGGLFYYFFGKKWGMVYKEKEIS